MNPEILLINSHRNVSQHSAARKQGELTPWRRGHHIASREKGRRCGPRQGSSPAQPAGPDVAAAPKRNLSPPKRQNARKTRQSAAEALPARLASVTDRWVAGQRRNGNRHFTRSLLEANDKLGVRPAATEAKKHGAAYFAQVAGLVPAGGPAAIGIPI